MEIRSGIKSSEFWLSFAAVMLGFFMSAGVFAADHWAIKAAGLAVAALSAMGYSASRGKVKAAASLSGVLPPAEE